MSLVFFGILLTIAGCKWIGLDTPPESDSPVAPGPVGPTDAREEVLNGVIDSESSRRCTFGAPTVQPGDRCVEYDRFQGPTEGTITAELEWQEQDVDLDLYILSGNGSVIDSSNRGTTRERVSGGRSAGQAFTVAIHYRSGGSAVMFTLTIERP